MKILRLVRKWFIIIFSVFLFVQISIQKRPMGMERKDYNETEVNMCIEYLMKNVNPYLAPPSNKISKIKVDNELEVYDYDEYFLDLDWLSADGCCVVPFRKILIDDDLIGFSYIITLTHEILHYREYCSNDRYIEFMTFKVLFESNDPYLVKAGIIHGYSCITSTAKDRYWCADLIIDYLKKEKLC